MTAPDATQLTSVSTDVDFDPFACIAPIELASTPAQFEMWLSAQASPGAVCAHNESFSVQLAGPLEVDALDRAIATLADMHEALRGHFTRTGERFVIEPSVVVPIGRHDLSVLPSDEARSMELERLRKSEAETPFDLVSGPLFRTTMVRLGPEQTVLLMSAHHSICDGWSLDVLLADLGALYSGFVGSDTLARPPKHGFSDFIAHCQTKEHLVRVERSRGSWRQLLQPAPAPLELPFDGFRPALRSYEARHHLHRCQSQLLVRAKDFARSQGISLFSVLLAGLASLLHRITEATDIVIGIPIAGHPDVAMEDCVGHLVNLVPIRLRIPPQTSFGDLCRAAATAVLDARENAYVSFGQILADINVPRDPSRVPLVSVVFTHTQKYAPGRLKFGTCRVDYHLNPRRFETFELHVNAMESAEALQLLAHANSDLFTADWLNWRLSELDTLLLAGIAAPETAVSDLGLLPENERTLVVEGFNATSIDYPPPFTLSELFEQSVRRRADRTALVDSATGSTMTFAEMDLVTGRLAELLRQHQCDGAVVGVLMERSLAMVCALYAIVRAGSTYLPLDPEYPASRLQMMVADADCATILTSTSLASLGNELHTKALDVDELWPQITADGPVYTALPDPERNAYIIYTSGSTGLPKGVPNSHRAVVNRLWWQQDMLKLTEDDRVIQKTPYTFDVSVWEFFWPVLWGGTLVVLEPGAHRDPAALARTLSQHRVTIAHFVPTMLRLFLEHPSARSWTTVRAVICSGEALPTDLCDFYYSAFSAPLYNYYGPTEAAVDVTACLVQPSDSAKFVPIGKPVANTKMYVLNDRDQPLPIGVTGHLHIGGVQVSRGYLKRPELTQQRFVPDPFCTSGTATMYRTGDRGRWHADGQLEYLGRSDGQVKLRGNRIELGDVESTLRTHAAVAEAVVLVRNRAGADELVAYVVPRDANVSGSDLVEHCRRQLPAIMVPAQIGLLDALPLLASGKLDRSRLPDLQRTAPPRERSGRTQNDQERRVHEAWALRLGHAEFDLDSNFFDVGGNSILAAKVVQDLEAVFERKINLTLLFQYPTVESLARFLGQPAADQNRALGDSVEDRARKQREARKRQNPPRV